MPPKKQDRGSRARRQAAARQRQTVRQRVPQVDGASDEEMVAEATPTALRPARASTPPTTARRSRASRTPAQIVVANYDFLRHDLRLLGVLAPSLVVVMVVLSFVVH